jgi:hypothetical protein
MKESLFSVFIENLKKQSFSILLTLGVTYFQYTKNVQLELQRDVFIERERTQHVELILKYHDDQAKLIDVVNRNNQLISELISKK